MNKPTIPEIQIDKANQELWKNRFSNSAEVVSDALKLLSKAEKINYEKGVACSKLNIAAANFLQSKTDIALRYLSESFSWFENNKGEQGYINALLLKGNIYESFGDYEKTLHLWLEAYKISTELKDRESEGEACSQLGLIYSRLCNFKKALEFFNKSLRLREELNDENAMASSFNRIGMVHRQTGNYEKALEYYIRSLKIREKNNQESAMPWTLLGIASTYEEMKRFPEALEYYELGMKGPDKRCSTQCMMGAGRVYSHMGNGDLAEERIKVSQQMAQELGSLALVADAHYALAAHYELFNNPEKALQSIKQYLRSKESLNSSEVQSRLSNIEVAHAVEKSEQEKEIFRLKHVELKKAYDIIEETNREVRASINYASRIQRAILPEPDEIPGLKERLVLFYMPKDIVSGDFYWFSQVKEKLVIAAADCTGHGVPGALMSMLGISFLGEIVNSRSITKPGLIMNELRKEVQLALRQTGKCEEAKDGMDMALCTIDTINNRFQYSGAYNNLYLISEGELTEYPADRMPIGIFDKSGLSFTTTSISLHTGDFIYMFSDGYADQFGGPGNKKFKSSRFKELLLSIHQLPVNKQKSQLEKVFLDWKGENQQIDDVLVLGYKG
jgi:serine phosphatase RsbU (regulator of sigma subunit)